MKGPNVLDLSAVVSREAARLEEDVRLALGAMGAEDRKVREAHLLTVAERGVLRLIGLGLGNEAIGEALRVSTGTVRTHAKRLYDKCGVEGRARLAVVAQTIAERGLWREDRETAGERREARVARRAMLAEMVA